MPDWTILPFISGIPHFDSLTYEEMISQACDPEASSANRIGAFFEVLRRNNVNYDSLCIASVLLDCDSLDVRTETVYAICIGFSQGRIDLNSFVDTTAIVAEVIEKLRNEPVEALRPAALMARLALGDESAKDDAQQIANAHPIIELANGRAKNELIRVAHSICTGSLKPVKLV
ncbi:hypothetical protein [Planctomicrobium piriforme]|uniref:Uncharacterized protein n=1 Tax=Planctomicrobium piriforme TaxID=1576369 RepID=A0A1I3ELD1_9PLAN|nr:hypothetical protein [Planctomicrobium piriforme]SFH99794.1 hypothetical protein SAMN05421753_104276 [Planctomicrobium piriforme]